MKAARVRIVRVRPKECPAFGWLHLCELWVEARGIRPSSVMAHLFDLCGAPRYMLP